MNIDDAEQLKRLIVDPMIAAVKVEMQGHVDQMVSVVKDMKTHVDDHDERLNTLEKNQKKGMVGWGVLTLAVGTGVTLAWNYIRSKIHFS